MDEPIAAWHSLRLAHRHVLCSHGAIGLSLSVLPQRANERDTKEMARANPQLLGSILPSWHFSLLTPSQSATALLLLGHISLSA